MPKSAFDSVNLQECLTRWQTGDRAAADELLRGTGPRLEKLAKRMIRAFPNIRSQADTGDVLQNSMIRLLRSLRRMRPATTRDFFNLAAVHIRRELIDLARRCRSKKWMPFDVPGAPDLEPECDTTPDFEFWERFHKAVDKLPLEEREVVGLIFYHGWKRGRIAKLFAVDERTIRRRWSRACEHLREIVGGEHA